MFNSRHVGRALANASHAHPAGVTLLIHEIGHCLVAWVHGCPAIPTPAREYILQPLSPAVQNQVALGGVIGTMAVLAGVLCWMLRHPTPTSSVLLAGAMTLPGFYSLRFFLAGRGHDATEASVR